MARHVDVTKTAEAMNFVRGAVQTPYMFLSLSISAIPGALAILCATLLQMTLLNSFDVLRANLVRDGATLLIILAVSGAVVPFSLWFENRLRALAAWTYWATSVLLGLTLVVLGVVVMGVMGPVTRLSDLDTGWALVLAGGGIYALFVAFTIWKIVRSPRRLRLQSAGFPSSIGLPQGGVLSIVRAEVAHATSEEVSAYRRAITGRVLLCIGASWLIVFAVLAAASFKNPRVGLEDMNFDAVRTLAKIATTISTILLIVMMRRHRSKFLMRLWGRQRRDSGPFTLYLRSFNDDQKLRRLRPSLSMDGYSNPLWVFARTSFEEIVTDGLWKFGPVVAIGQPGEGVPAPGSAREYVGHDAWQARVTLLAERAQAIVLLAGLTPGLAWEIKKLIDHGHAHKLVLVLPGLRHAEARQRWSALAKGAQLDESLIPDRVNDGLDPLVIAGFGSGRMTIFAAKKRTNAAFDVSTTLAVASIVAATKQRRAEKPAPATPTSPPAASPTPAADVRVDEPRAATSRRTPRRRRSALQRLVRILHLMYKFAPNDQPRVPEPSDADKADDAPTKQP